MEIIYVVNKLESCQGYDRVIDKQEFFSVDDAITFHKKQKNTDFSWWVINVEYKD